MLQFVPPDPLARDLMTYGRLILREAQRHGGMGWLEYDRVFRQQAAVERAKSQSPCVDCPERKGWAKHLLYTLSGG